MKQKKPLNLNPFVLIFAVVVVAWLFTFIITPGTLVDGVYTALPKNAFNFNNVFNLFRAVPMGIKDTSNLVILVLVIGGALEIYIGVVFQPRTFSAQDLSTSELLRTLLMCGCF